MWPPVCGNRKCLFLYEVFLCIRSECGKTLTRKIPSGYPFHAMIAIIINKKSHHVETSPHVRHTFQSEKILPNLLCMLEDKISTSQQISTISNTNDDSAIINYLNYFEQNLQDFWFFDVLRG